jgi:hypothetical protein
MYNLHAAPESPERLIFGNAPEQALKFPRALGDKPACILITQWQECDQDGMTIGYSGDDGLEYQFSDRTGWSVIGRSWPGNYKNQVSVN